ncbi:MAG: calcium/sodium antiporter [Gemmatimonadota bacterium]|uniref:calcium/sodium antiporter n=1 Tax=Candidatus Palauibacter scopulicola TaxID=3056741 RepID=UPI00238B73A4|nr:calcium/sodium antiporter [Candidatus Palauibacter scopulicola]MDE2662763.1 calcium/sodium antiporter [Candidatus Palauibacter scopulicola]
MRNTLLFAFAFVPLTLGADWLVRGAAGLAQRFGVSPLVVGLTVVAFGTSAPELVVSALASLEGQPDVAVGNIMGSTAANVGLIVGIGALIRPIEVHRRVIVRETPLVIIVLSLVMVLSLNDAVGRLDGLLLVSGWALYLFFLLKWERVGVFGTPERAPGPDAPAPGTGTGPAETDIAAPGAWWSLVRIGLGLPCLTYGARWLLEGAEGIARSLAVPEAVIAATLIAVGTSLPELASTLVAAFRRMGDIAIGNVIGSNVFNLGLVLGTAALVRPLVLDPTIVVGYVLPALAFSVILIPLALHRGTVQRTEGGLLLLLYLAYIVMVWWFN